MRRAWASLLLLTAAPCALAAETPRRSGGIETVIVTATKRSAKLQKLPQAVTAISGAKLREQGAQDIAAVTANVPSLAITRRSPSQNQVSIRGLASFTDLSAVFPMVGLYVDEVPITDNLAPDVGLIDLKRVEVLRGPQGTLYGEGSLGGTIRYVLNQPDPGGTEAILDGDVSATSGGDPNWRYDGIANIPLVKDRAALRVLGFSEHDGGFITNRATGKRNADSWDRYGGRGALLLQPTEAVTVNLSGAWQRYGGGIDPVVYPDQRPGITPPLLNDVGDTSGYRQINEATDDQLHYLSGVVTWNTDFATITSASSYYRRRLGALNDEENTSRQLESGFDPLAGAIGESPFYITKGTITRYRNNQRTYAQEIRLSSAGETRLRWTAGAYFRDRQIKESIHTAASEIVPLIQLLNPDYALDGLLLDSRTNTTFRQYAVFGEATLGILSNLDLIAGLRYYNEEITGLQRLETPDFSLGPAFGNTFLTAPPALRTTNDGVLWRFGLSWRPTPDIQAYVTASQGFRPGGVNPRFNPNVSEAASPRSFQADTATTTEIGVKSAWLQNRLTVNVAGYITDLSNPQFLDASDATYNVIRNAGAARVMGAEIELVARPVPALNVSLSGGLLEAVFTENALPLEPGLYVIRDGQNLPISRKASIAFGADYTWTLSDRYTLNAATDLAAVSGALANTTRPETDTGGIYQKLSGYTIANARLTLQAPRWSLTAYIKNLSNEFAQYGGYGAFGISRNKPLTVGLRARTTF